MVTLAAAAASARAGDSVKNADGDWISASDYPAQLASRPLVLPGGLTEVELAPTLRIFPSQPYPGSLALGPMWPLFVRRGMGSWELGAQLTMGMNLRPGPIRLEAGYIPDDPWLLLYANLALEEWGRNPDDGFFPAYNVFAMNVGTSLKAMRGHDVALELSPAIGFRVPFGDGAAMPSELVLAADCLLQLNVGPSVGFELGATPRFAGLSIDSLAVSLDAWAGIFYTDRIIDLGMSVESRAWPAFLTSWAVATHVRLRLGL